MTQEEIISLCRYQDKMYFVMPDTDGVKDGSFSLQVVEDSITGCFMKKGSMTFQLQTELCEDFPIEKFPRFKTKEEALSQLKAVIFPIVGQVD